MLKLLIHILLFALLASCGGGDGESTRGGTNTPPAPGVPPGTGTWYRPALSATWQWQLNGVVNTTYSVDIYDIDLFDSSTMLIQDLHTSGKRVICYFSAGTYEPRRSDSNDFQAQDRGNPVVGWPDEAWLDIRSPNVQTIMKSRLDLAVQKGCDAVEPDNVDGYTNNPGFPLTAADQLAYNRLIANEAHLRGLAVGLKNDLDQVNDLVSYYDFAVNEQCFEYNECGTLQPFISAGKPVFSAEYNQTYVNDTAARNAMCAESIRLRFSTLVLPLALDGSYRGSCL